MPIYEYVCEACGNEREEIHKISVTPEMICENCAGTKWRKKTSMSAFHLKGGGWYKDGYGNGKKDNPANNSGPNNPGAGASEAKKGSDLKTNDKTANNPGSADSKATKKVEGGATAGSKTVSKKENK